MTREVALALARELADAVNAHDTARLLALYDENAVTVSPVAGQITGIEQIARWWDEIFHRFPDWSVQTTDVLLDGDRVAFFGTARATDRSGWFGQPPTGEAFEYRALIVLTIRDGKIIRDERVYDSAALLQRFEKVRLDQELRLAGEVQRALLPHTVCFTDFAQVAADSIACRAIGGDFFEAVTLPSGQLALALGDVAGKGPSAALLAAMIQGMVNIEMNLQSAPATIVAHLNQRLSSRRLEPRFTSLVYAAISPAGDLTCCNAGHNPPVVMTKGGARRIVSGGPILGVFSQAAFEQETVRLEEGDLLVLFSDGLIEARDRQGHEFGDERLLAALSELREQPAADILTSLLARVHEHAAEAPQEDDITLLVARFGGSAA